jgi:hypothetical protein
VSAEQEAAVRLTPARVRLAADIIAKTEDYRGGCNGCDDCPWPDYFTTAERRTLIVDYHTWNGDPEEATESNIRHAVKYGLGWGSLFGYLTEALLKVAGETTGARS